MSDTPETDAIQHGRSAGSYFAMMDHARSLESRLTTALAARKEAQDHQLRLAAELVEARKQIARLEQENMDHAESWAFCGIPHDSILTRLLVEADLRQKLCIKAEDFIAWICPLFKERTPETHETLIALTDAIRAARQSPDKP